MAQNIGIRKPLSAIICGALFALPAVGAAQQTDQNPTSVSESAPARTGAASVPTGPGGRQPLAGGTPAYPPQGAAGVSESMPATAGRAATPTAGQGQSATPVGRTESMNRLPQTPSSVSESAPARSGAATVPTARYTRNWDEADANNDGVIDRFEFDRWMTRQQTARR
jgi:hypothetical protein